MVNVWQKCHGNKYTNKIKCNVWRVVENQYQTSTRKLVDNLIEHERLEEIIDAYKPELSGSYQKYHYLLSTPFRYPPLKHGSRFGNRSEPSLWYGSLTIETALAEKAFHRFRMLEASEANFHGLSVKYSAFECEIETLKGIDLTDVPFRMYTKKISCPHSYAASQQIGTQMRSEGIQAFLYKSARCPKKNRNIALFTPVAFKKNVPIEPFHTWQGIVDEAKATMDFIRTNGLVTETKHFSKDQFLIDGGLPNPAI